MPAFSFEDTSKPFSYRSTAEFLISRLHDEELFASPQRDFRRRHITSDVSKRPGDNLKSDMNLVAEDCFGRPSTISDSDVSSCQDDNVLLKRTIDDITEKFATLGDRLPKPVGLTDGEPIVRFLDRLGEVGQRAESDAFGKDNLNNENSFKNTLPLKSESNIDDKVSRYLWEVANQNKYLQERQKYRFHIIPDGNCLYRAVSRAAYGAQSLHKELREQTIHHIADHLDEFNSIVEDDVGEFLISASQDGVWAGYPELLAMSNLLKVNIYLTTGGSFESPTVSTMVHFLGEEDTTRPVVWLSWLSNGHYDVILNHPVPNPEYNEWCRSVQTQRVLDEQLAKSINKGQLVELS